MCNRNVYLALFRFNVGCSGKMVGTSRVIRSSTNVNENVFENTSESDFQIYYIANVSVHS